MKLWAKKTLLILHVPVLTAVINFFAMVLVPQQFQITAFIFTALIAFLYGGFIGTYLYSMKEER